MPGRWTSAAIVALWLIMMTWLTVREAWHRFGASPTFPDALAASAGDVPSSWTILENGHSLGKATTHVALKLRQGRYELRQHIHLERFFGLGGLFGHPMSLRLDNRTDVNHLGELEEFTSTILIPEIDLRCHLVGHPIANGELSVQASVTSNGQEIFAPREYRLSYGGKDLILNSLCPLDRMPLLRPGQRWEAPMVDPLESLTQVVERPPVKVEVLEDPQELLWGDDWVPCWVVEARQPHVQVRIWVRQKDGLVLKQTVHWEATTLEVIRDSRSPSEP
jgi:hypothetical protein